VRKGSGQRGKQRSPPPLAIQSKTCGPPLYIARARPPRKLIPNPEAFSPPFSVSHASQIRSSIRQTHSLRASCCSLSFDSNPPLLHLLVSSRAGRFEMAVGGGVRVASSVEVWGRRQNGTTATTTSSRSTAARRRGAATVVRCSCVGEAGPAPAAGGLAEEHYRTLRLRPGATRGEIKKAFRRLALTVRSNPPSRNPLPCSPFSSLPRRMDPPASSAQCSRFTGVAAAAVIINR
jgi:hypothetical protein